MISVGNLDFASSCLEPGEAIQGASAIVEGNPPGHTQVRSRVSVSGRTASYVGLRLTAEFIPIDNGQINTPSREGIVSAEQIWPDQRRVHQAPGKHARVELGRRALATPRCS